MNRVQALTAAKKNATPNHGKHKSPTTPSLIRWSIQEVRRIDMEMLNDREVYFEVNELVNKSLRFRDAGVFFDEYGKDKPDFMIRMWVEEAIDGEVEFHTLQVWVNDIGKSPSG
jgi:hypothetical protein